jgi:hypothetical protein
MTHVGSERSLARRHVVGTRPIRMSYGFVI